MVKKIFEALKQAYSPLGLGDTFLQGWAERMNASGSITDENLAEQVTAQKTTLEVIQSSLDTRVGSAQKKWQEEQQKAAAEAEKKRAEMQKQHDELIAKQKEEYEKQIADLKKKQTTQPKNKTEMTEEEIIEQYKQKEAAKLAEREAQEKAWREQREAYEAERKKEREQYEAERRAEREKYEKEQNEKYEAMMKKMEEMSNANSKLTTQLDTINAEKAAAEKAAAKAARDAAIKAKAKELGIPEWRIAEGFSIADDADETKYTEVLTGIASNIKNNMLPPNSPLAHLAGDDKAPEKEEIDAIVGQLMQKERR